MFCNCCRGHLVRRCSIAAVRYACSLGLIIAMASGQLLADLQVKEQAQEQKQKQKQEPKQAPVLMIAAELAPYGYRSAGRITGLGVEIMAELSRRLNHAGDIRLMPFKRAYQNARSRDRVLMTPVARVASREGQLKWAIHYIDDHFFYVSRAGTRRLTHQLARQGGLIGVLAGSAPLAQLQLGGVTHYLEQTLDTANINMLRMGRIDGWFTSALLLNAAFKSNPELNPADFQIGEVQSSHCVYIVASNATSDAALHLWRQTYAAMQADGTVAEIMDRYLDRDLQQMLGREALQTECGGV